MDRGIAALLGALIIIFLFYLLLGRSTETVTTVDTPAAAAAPAPVVINNPQSVVVGDRAAVNDVVPQTGAVPAQGYYGQVAVPSTQLYPLACTGVCTTACPTTVISGYCPTGTICCG